MTKPVCVVVGVGPGNGAAFARRFAREGHAVALLARTPDYSTELAATLPGARAYTCDVSRTESVQSALQAVERDLGAIEVLVYNAGSGVWGTIEEISPDDLEQAVRVNTVGLL